MARKRRVSKRRAEITPEQEAWLAGDDNGAGFFKYHREDELAEFWAEHRDRVVSEHVEQWPGTRPLRWWQYDAPRSQLGTYLGDYYDGKLPEQRKRLGGIGTPCFECLSVVPSFSFGIPNYWLEPELAKYYRGLAKDIHGDPIGVEYFCKGFAGVAIDPNDPPVHESQAAYLKRLGLFMPGERKQLTKEDFEPEAVTSAF